MKYIYAYILTIPLLYMIVSRLSETVIDKLNRTGRFKIKTSRDFHSILAGSLLLAGLGVVILLSL